MGAITTGENFLENLNQFNRLNVHPWPWWFEQITCNVLPRIEIKQWINSVASLSVIMETTLNFLKIRRIWSVFSLKVYVSNMNFPWQFQSVPPNWKVNFRQRNLTNDTTASLLPSRNNFPEKAPAANIRVQSTPPKWCCFPLNLPPSYLGWNQLNHHRALDLPHPKSRSLWLRPNVERNSCTVSGDLRKKEKNALPSRVFQVIGKCETVIILWLKCH